MNKNHQKGKINRKGGWLIMKKCFDVTALALVIIGAVNWGLIGVIRFDLVAFLFGQLSWFTRLVYILVGLSGLYLLSFFGQLDNE